MAKNNLEIYINFDEVDNKSRHDDEWVGTFKNNLLLTLEQLLGYQPQVFASNELLFKEKSKNHQVLITILSDHSLNSEKIQNNLKYFSKIHHKENWVVNGVDSQGKIFKILKSPVPYDQQPDSIRDLLSYDFYLREGKTGAISEFTPFSNEKINKSYWIKISEIAYNISEFIEPTNQITLYDQKHQAVVYLAETGPDLITQRYVLRRELQRSGYKVLPKKNYPMDKQAFEQMVEEDLSGAHLFIQLMGMYYDELSPIGKSYAEVQYRKAVPGIQDKKLRGLIWMPLNLHFADVRQKEFFDHVRRDLDTREGLELIQSTLEELREFIQKVTLNRSGPKKPENAPKSDSAQVYVIFDEVDKDQGQHLAQIIAGSGYQVQTPQFDGHFVKLREIHQQNLINFDYAILYCGLSNENWVRMQLMDLLKSTGMGRKKPVLVKLVLKSDASINLEKLRNFKIDVFSLATQELNFEVVQDLLSNIKPVVLSQP